MRRPGEGPRIAAHSFKVSETGRGSRAMTTLSYIGFCGKRVAIEIPTNLANHLARDLVALGRKRGDLEIV